MQAKDIPDHAILATVKAVQRARAEQYTLTYPDDLREAVPASRWDIEERLSEIPTKVVMAKIRGLLRRGLLDGCGCGCRGDLELTDRGEALLRDANQTAIVQGQAY